LGCIPGSGFKYKNPGDLFNEMINWVEWLVWEAVTLLSHNIMALRSEPIFCSLVRALDHLVGEHASPTLTP
jgi:hypothetical protein